MQRPVIDEIYKKALLRWEEGNDCAAELAKEGVWQAVNRPKRTRKTHWVFISSVAATLVLLMVSGILFLKLGQTQKELLALQDQIDTKIAVSTSPKVEKSTTEDLGGTPEETPEEKVMEAPIAIPDKKPLSDPWDQLAELKPEDSPYVEPIHANRREVFDPPLVLDRSEFPEESPIAELIFPEQKGEQASFHTNSKVKPKLKVGFGKGQQAQNAQHALALNIKL